MTRWAAAWVLCAAFAACTPIYTEPDSGPANQLLLFNGVAKPALGVIASEAPIGVPNGPCSIRITALQISSTNPDAGAVIFGSAYLNLESDPPPTPNNNSPLQFFSQLPFSLVGPGTGSPPLFDYSPRQLPIVIGLDSLVSLLFLRTDPRTNYLTLKVTDGVTTLDLMWNLNLSKCDHRPY
jgi:hypothetical protein